VEDAVEGNISSLGIAKQTFNGCAIGDIGFNKLDAWGNEAALGVAEIINDDDLISLLGEECSDGSADVAGTARYHDFHKKCPLCCSLI
jgi:hypothetical protein